MFTALIHGFLLALGLILPLGAQNMFVFSQGAIQAKFSRAIPVVITAALCDTFLILLAVLGVSAIILTFSWVKILLVAAGILFLGYIGLMTWRSDTSDPKTAIQNVRNDMMDGRDDSPNGQNQALWPASRLVLFSVSVSLLNPHAILDTIGVIGTSSIQYPESERVFFAGACVLVSWLWFFSLALAGRGLGSVPQIKKYLGKVSALIMWVSAVYLMYALLWAKN